MPMARKIFITFLGTTPYKECVYDDSEVVRFVQEAIVNNLCTEWTENDCIYVFLTEDAERKNWKGELYNGVGLETVLNNKNLNCQIKAISSFKEGMNEADIWGNFVKIYDCLQKEDLIYLDITNSFRSIPLFTAVLLNYARFLKQTTTKAVYYGAFEAIGVPAYEVEQKIKDPKDRKATIIDLTNLINLQLWTVASSDFVRYGNSAALVDLLKQDKELNKIATTVQELTAALSINNLQEAFATTQKLDTQLKRIKATDMLDNPAKRLVANLIEKFPERFQKTIVAEGKLFTPAGFEAQADLIQYYLNNEQQYVQAITVAREALVSKYCIVHDMTDIEALKYKNRDKISKWLGDMADKIKPQKKKQNADNITNMSSDALKLAKLWGRLTQLRNQIDHAFMEPNNSRTKNATNNVGELCADVIKYLTKDIDILKNEKTNFSNPPSLTQKP
jgi:CRISPR-associated Csx2 family protein